MDNKDLLGTYPIRPLLWKLGVPTVVAQVINMLYNIVDRVYIGHIPHEGALALTGVGVTFPLIMFVAAFASLVCNGGAPRASIFLGRQHIKAAERTFGACFTLQIVLSIILTAVLLIFNRELLLLFGASNRTIGYATSYMNIYAFGTIFSQLTLGLNAFVTAQGFTKVTMQSVLVGSILNIVLDPFFIFYFHMGVQGAAVATIISQAVSCAWTLKFTFSKKSILKLRRRNLKIQWQIIWPVITLGMAGFIMKASESILAICFNSSLLHYGGDIAVGAMTILASVTQFMFLPLTGIGQSAQPIMSYNFGARNIERVKETFKVLVTVSLGFSLVFWVVTMIFPTFFIKMFTTNPNLIEFTIKALRIYMASMGIFGIQIACQFTFNSLGNAKASIMVAVMRKIILLIPLIYILPNVLPINPTISVYLAEPISDFLSVAFTIGLFSYQLKSMLGEAGEDVAEG